MNFDDFIEQIEKETGFQFDEECLGLWKLLYNKINRSKDFSVIPEDGKITITDSSGIEFKEYSFSDRNELCIRIAEFCLSEC